MTADLGVHPLAAAFPMLGDEDLDALADSISTHGQRHPILISKWKDPATDQEHDVIVDGRNRYEACRRAGIEPKIERLNGVDVAALIMAENVERRSLSTGQRAMARAILMPEGKVGRPKKDAENPELSAGFSARYLAQARTVLRVDPDLAKRVMAGIATLSDAYRQARIREASEKESTEKLYALRKRWPDLADQVDEEKLSLDDAFEKAKQAERDEREQSISASQNFLENFGRLKRSPDFASDDADQLSFDFLRSSGFDLSVERLHQIRDYQVALIERLIWRLQNEKAT